MGRIKWIDGSSVAMGVRIALDAALKGVHLQTAGERRDENCDTVLVTRALAGRAKIALTSYFRNICKENTDYTSF